MIRVRSIDILEASKSRPSNYLERVRLLSLFGDDYCYFTPENYRSLRLEFSPMGTWPDLLRTVAKLRRPNETGIGDTIHRLIPLADEFEKWFLRFIGHSCGCADRREWLNLRYPFSK